MKVVLNIIGIILVFFICWLCSYNRKRIPWKSVLKMLALEFLLTVLIIKVPIGQKAITIFANAVNAVIGCSKAGLTFVFGDLYTGGSTGMYVFAIQVLGNIIFLSALVSALYYLGILGFVIKWIGKAVSKFTKTTEVESFVAVSNMFLGQTDSPLLVAKYMPMMTNSELFVVLVSGLGSMSASILGGYSSMGIPMENLLIASVLVPVGSIMLAKIICPQVEQSQQITDIKLDCKGQYSNVIDAIADGCINGLKLVACISAALVGFIAMIAMVDMILGLVNLNCAQIFSYVFAPFGYLMGFDGADVFLEGRLLGSKFILNEFVAFEDLGGKIASLDPRTALVATISLCGFANVGSIGVCIGGIGTLCPEKRGIISTLIIRALIAGVFVSINSALLVSIVYLLF